jgi:YgiT-type zinc finger domain-containing protein
MNMTPRRKGPPFNARLDTEKNAFCGKSGTHSRRRYDWQKSETWINDLRHLRRARSASCKTHKVFGKGRKMIVIENIPFISCQTCGQNYMTRDVMLTVDKIRIHRETMTPAQRSGIRKIA